MTTMEAIQKRHSVRHYSEQDVKSDILTALQAEIDECNVESGLNIRLVVNDPDTFNGLLAKVRFTGAKNYIVLAGKESTDLEEKAGYYGERVVLKAQQLGLNTCWAMMFNGKKYATKLDNGEKIVIIIAVGYGATQGVERKSKPMESLCKVDGEMPDWFRSGMEAAMLAPTSLNKQGFLITLSGNTVKAESKGSGAMSLIDLGIVKYHFEIGAGNKNFSWS